MAMNKTDLINAVAGATGMTKVDSEKSVKATLDAITNQLASGESVSLIGFGTFSVSERSARVGKNPRTGESLEIPAKRVAKFKAGKALADSVNVVTETKKKAKKK